MLSRRRFFTSLAATGVGSALVPGSLQKLLAQVSGNDKPSTNINEAMKHPRIPSSMPGKFPGKVVQIVHDRSVVGKNIDPEIASEMVKKGMLTLSGSADLPDAWRMFVLPTDRIGLKVNPVAGPLLSTSLEITRAVIHQLEEAGIPKENILIWDRREFELHEAGFTAENFPGIKILGTERKDEKGSFYDSDGKLYGERMIDRDWYYMADCEEKYDADTLPYMINEGKYSYFSSIVTQQVDKIINIPILKNAGPTVTLCMKNLAFGSISNTGRLHKKLWAETCAEVCAFPPLRDKVVLNIADGLRGCYNGGPEAKPEFITEYKTILVGTDPVAVDRIGYEIILKKRIEEKVQKEDNPKGRKFMELAQDLQLGTAKLDKIELNKISLS
ncbi:MAG: DUF362 domain-containing protein [Bacteroidota bacterium]|jgi:hypothetical protein